MPPDEIHYFSSFYERKVWEWYARHFVNAGMDDLIGENSNSYMTDKYAACRIHAHLPDAKLVAVLRNPIERAYSAYCMQFARGKVGKHPEMQLDPRKAQISHVIENGKYYAQLRRYVDFFPREQIHAIIFDDIVREAEAVLVNLATFLRVPQPERARPLPDRANVRRAAGMGYPLRRVVWPMVRQEAVRRPLVRFLGRMPLWRWTASVSARPIVYPPLPGDVRRRLAAYYAQDVSDLSRLLGRDLSCWLDVPVSARG